MSLAQVSKGLELRVSKTAFLHLKVSPPSTMFGWFFQYLDHNCTITYRALPFSFVLYTLQQKNLILNFYFRSLKLFFSKVCRIEMCRIKVVPQCRTLVVQSHTRWRHVFFFGHGELGATPKQRNLEPKYVGKSCNSLGGELSLCYISKYDLFFPHPKTPVSHRSPRMKSIHYDNICFYRPPPRQIAIRTSP